jgi:hypothetical protein
MNHILAAGYDVTNDVDRIDEIALGPPGEASDPTGTGAPFTIAKNPGGYELSWSSAFRGDRATEYELYRTHLAGFVPECETTLGSETSAILPTLPGGYGFLVVGRNDAGDGSPGRDSRGYDRPIAQDTGVCP